METVSVKLPKPLYEKLLEYKRRKNFAHISEAVRAILREFFEHNGFNEG